MAAEEIVNGVVGNVVNASIDSSASALDILANLPGVGIVIRLAQVALVVVIVYIAFLIIKIITGINSSRALRKLARNVEEINGKMDKLVKIQSGKGANKSKKNK